MRTGNCCVWHMIHCWLNDQYDQCCLFDVLRSSLTNGRKTRQRCDVGWASVLQKLRCKLNCNHRYLCTFNEAISMASRTRCTQWPLAAIWLADIHKACALLENDCFVLLLFFIPIWMYAFPICVFFVVSASMMMIYGLLSDSNNLIRGAQGQTVHNDWILPLCEWTWQPKWIANERQHVFSSWWNTHFESFQLWCSHVIYESPRFDALRCPRT